MWEMKYRSVTRIALAILTATFIAAHSCADDQQPPSTVRVVIDFGDGVEKHFTRVPWHDGLTVWETLQAAAQHPRGVRVEHRGAGQTLFVTKIDDVKNEGGSGRNWIFRVKGQLGERSAAISPVQLNDEIRWTFEASP